MSEATQYDATHARWKRDPEAYWAEAARGIDWDRAPKRIFDAAMGVYGRWFPDAALNTCHNAVDRHVAAGRGQQDAIIYDSPMTGQVQRITYAALQNRVAKLAGALAARGITKGDRVVIYMPMVPEAAIAMLATARLGAVHSVVFGGFAAAELASRIADAKPKAIISASCGLEPGRVVKYKPLLDEAIALSPHKPSSVLILQRPQAPCEMIAGRDEDLLVAEAAAAPHGCISVAATDPLYILYTSGTTGQPKGILRDNGGHAVALHHSMDLVYGVKPGDVYWAASDVGWVVGHSYIVYAPLLAGCATVLFEGKPVGTPDPGTFWRVCADHGVKILFTAPTAIRAIKKEDPEGIFLKKYDLSKLEALYLAGERCDPDTIIWSERLLQKPVRDHWWQTETGGHMITSLPGAIPNKPGSATKPFFGVKPVILDPATAKVQEATETDGVLCIADSWPGQMRTLWGDHQRFEDAYFAQYRGYYFTGDGCRRDADGYYWITGRVDDVINVSGHRMGTAEVESALVAHPKVAESAVVGYPHDIKGQGIYAYVTLMNGVEPTDALKKELEAWVRTEIGPIAKPDLIQWAPGLPKTRSGKIMRRILRKIAENDYAALGDTSTLADPTVVQDLIENRMNRA
jgi:acetate--CoA ligase